MMAAPTISLAMTSLVPIKEQPFPTSFSSQSPAYCGQFALPRSEGFLRKHSVNFAPFSELVLLGVGGEEVLAEPVDEFPGCAAGLGEMVVEDGEVFHDGFATT